MPSHREDGGEPRRDSTSQGKPKDATSTRRFVVFQVSSEAEAISYLQSQPDVISYQGANGLLVADQYTPTDRLNTATMAVEVSYKNEEDEDEDLEIGEWEFSFDTTGRTVNRKISKKTVASGGLEKVFFPDEYEPTIDFRQGINVSSDGTVEGVDVTVPNFKFEITKKFNNAQLTLAFADDLEELTGKANDKKITITQTGQDPYSFQKGELLFLGARGTHRKKITKKNTTQSSDVLYFFHRQRNKSNFQPVPQLKPIEHKSGWDYLWFHFEENIVTDADGEDVAVLPVAIQWNIEQVVELGDFAKLQLF